jgi:hypothetical protein
MKRTELQRGTKQLQRRTSLQASSSLSRSPVKRRSEKGASGMRLYGLARALYLAAHEACERCSSAPAVLVHHRRGRTGLDLTDPEFFAALCDRCHRETHANPAQSYIDGWLIPRTHRRAA